MYLAHYGLRSQPFGMAADPEFFWEGPGLRETCRAFEEALRRNAACVLLTGEVGTGKTVLVRRALHAVQAEGLPLDLAAPHIGPGDLYGMLALELGLESGGGSDRPASRAALARRLPAALGSRERLWLIVEEAQRLGLELLREVVGLADLEADGRRPFRIFLLGSPEFEARLAQEDAREIRRRIDLHRRLEPLSAAATRDYVAHRLAIAGACRMLFTAEALERIHALSRGIPRLINMLCDHALLYGFSAHRQTITPDVVEEASQDLLVALDRDTAPEIEYRPGMVPAAEAPAHRRPRTELDLRRILAITAAAALLGAAAWLLTR